MRLLDNVFDDMVDDEVKKKIIMKEGYKDINIKNKYYVENLKSYINFNYIEKKGRPVVIVRNKKIVEKKIKDFELK
jgi:hypothetical protein